MTTPAVPTGEMLHRAALRHAIYAARAEEAHANAKAARTAAEIVFAVARSHGVPQVEVLLPDGTKAGLVSIERGPATTEVDEDLLTLVIASNDPGDFEDFIPPSVLGDPEVIALIAEQFPHLISRRVKAEAMALYRKEIDDNGGLVLDRTGALGQAGERVRVATISHGEATGKFTLRPTSKGMQMVREALDAGLISDDGSVVAPPGAP